MDKSQQLFAHLNRSFDEVMEVRRPGVTALMPAIQAKHPEWSTLRVAQEAKYQWERARAGAAPSTKVPV